MDKVGCVKEGEHIADLVPMEDDNSWLDVVAQFLIKVPPAPALIDDRTLRNGSENFRCAYLSFLFLAFEAYFSVN